MLHTSNTYNLRQDSMKSKILCETSEHHKMA